MQDTIRCPKCNEEIKISQVISRDIEEGLRARLELPAA